jgi:peroxiredoxin
VEVWDEKSQKFTPYLTDEEIEMKNETIKQAVVYDGTSDVKFVYFYPKDNTSGCSLEAMDFTRLRKEFEEIFQRLPAGQIAYLISTANDIELSLRKERLDVTLEILQSIPEDVGLKSVLLEKLASVYNCS